MGSPLPQFPFCAALSGSQLSYHSLCRGFVMTGRFVLPSLLAMCRVLHRQIAVHLTA